MLTLECKQDQKLMWCLDELLSEDSAASVILLQKQDNFIQTKPRIVWSFIIRLWFILLFFLLKMVSSKSSTRPACFFFFHCLSQSIRNKSNMTLICVRPLLYFTTQNLCTSSKLEKNNNNYAITIWPGLLSVQKIKPSSRNLQVLKVSKWGQATKELRSLISLGMLTRVPFTAILLFPSIDLWMRQMLVRWRRRN